MNEERSPRTQKLLDLAGRRIRELLGADINHLRDQNGDIHLVEVPNVYAIAQLPHDELVEMVRRCPRSQFFA